MALLWVESFDAGGTTDGTMTTYLERKYSGLQIANMNIITGRIGGKGIRLWGDSHIQIETDNKQTIIIGFAFQTNSFAGVTNESLLQLLDDGSVQIELVLIDGGDLRIRRGSTTLDTTAALGLQVDVWYYIEVKIKIDNAGTYEVHVNATNVLNGNADTQETTNAYANQIRFIGDDVTHKYSFDDIFILDNTGASNNDFLGNMRVQIVRPDGDTVDIDWTPKNAGTNFSEVDELDVDDDTTYVETSNTADKDIYEYASLLNAKTIAGIMINTEARETDADNYYLKMIAKSGATETADTEQIIASSYTIITRIIENDPDTGIGWLLGGLNAAKFGFEAV